MSALPGFALYGREGDLLHLADLVDDELRGHSALDADSLRRMAQVLGILPRRTFRSKERVGVEIRFEDLPVLRRMLGTLYLDEERCRADDEETMTVSFEDWIFSTDAAIKQILDVSLVDRLGKLA